MTVAELRDRMSATELTEWMAYFITKNEAEKKAMDDAKREASPGGMGRRK